MPKKAENLDVDNSEAHIQQQIVIWFWNTYCRQDCNPRSLILSIPNEGDPRLAMLGARAGAADLLVFYAQPPRPPRIIFMEVKTPAGRQSPNQRKFEAHVKAMGMEYILVRSLQDAQSVFVDNDPRRCCVKCHSKLSTDDLINIEKRTTTLDWCLRCFGEWYFRRANAEGDVL